MRIRYLCEGVRHRTSSPSLWSDRVDAEDEQDKFEMQKGAIKPGQTVIVVDDLIATGQLFSLFLSPLMTVLTECRRICIRSGRVGQDGRRNCTRVSLHYRGRVPQGIGQAQRALL